MTKTSNCDVPNCSHSGINKWLKPAKQAAGSSAVTILVFDLPGRDEREDQHLQHPHQQLPREREVDLRLARRREGNVTVRPSLNHSVLGLNPFAAARSSLRLRPDSLSLTLSWHNKGVKSPQKLKAVKVFKKSECTKWQTHFPLDKRQQMFNLCLWRVGERGDKDSFFQWLYQCTLSLFRWTNR